MRPGRPAIFLAVLATLLATFFETLLRQGAGRGEAQIRAALAAARRSPFTVFERELPLG